MAVHGNQGKHRVTKCGPALSYPMFTLVTSEDIAGSVSHTPIQRYRVFHSHETTAQVYQEVAVPIIRSALHGYNGTIFAYGQTSSGKTYTMMGAPNNLGIIPQAVGEVFKIIQEIPNREFLLRVSYMEIYNESVTDLLCDNRKKKPLEVREDFNHTVYVADLTEEVVTIPEQVMQWIKKGESKNLIVCMGDPKAAYHEKTLGRTYTTSFHADRTTSYRHQTG
ncbi:unnamed protein product [Ranitomeya imitator]|uniref:Kinesin motor domain-containing protein n=1 Tax=Ranitomeya imitator TaxID=111125 RepID=A0ABN9KQ92_9NEOB|nr:unnamed protein product [Ranitomeya imitator]